MDDAECIRILKEQDKLERDRGEARKRRRRALREDFLGDREDPKTVLQVYMGLDMHLAIRNYSSKHDQPVSITVLQALRLWQAFQRALERGATAEELKAALRLEPGESV